ncbi:hypothetical protein LOTGIDRAFT_158587 [Lottia gigantea]|uniref:Uncharacterized protein n=1 Tax=Lottia gigantea TaxID=225164 RepID=V4AWU0_LOTGI|nr:hypothetical protein LOTGIDRAFT_158587 [Lottia gigantea]ESO99495.1 hypothetical protein LOTGIDRAFT_158587 [Lottia gigantea]
MASDDYPIWRTGQSKTKPLQSEFHKVEKRAAVQDILNKRQHTLDKIRAEINAVTQAPCIPQNPVDSSKKPKPPTPQTEKNKGEDDYPAEGDYEEGDYGEGDYEEGDYEEGDYEEGDYEEGDYEEGDYEEGDYGEGDYEEGDYEEGDYEEGDNGEGDYEEGDYEEGDYEDYEK